MTVMLIFILMFLNYCLTVSAATAFVAAAIASTAVGIAVVCTVVTATAIVAAAGAVGIGKIACHLFCLLFLLLVYNMRTNIKGLQRLILPL